MASVPRPASAIPSLHISSDAGSNGHTQHDADGERIRPQSAVDHNDGARMGTEHYDFAQSRQHNVSFERSVDGKTPQLSAGPFSAGPKTGSPSSPYFNNTSTNALVPVIALQTSIPKQHVSAEAALLHALTPKLMVVINAVIESERDQFEVQQDVTVTPSEEETIRRSIFEDFRWIDTLCRTPLLGPRAPATSRKLIEYNVQTEQQRPSPNRHSGMPSHLYADPYAASPPTMNPVAALGDNAFSSLGQPHMPSPSTAFAPPPHLAGQKRPFHDGQYARQTPPQHPYQSQGGHGSDPAFVQSTLSLLKGLLGMLHEMQSRNHAHASSASSGQPFEDPSTSKKDAAIHQQYQHKLASLLEATMGIKYISDFAQAQQIALPALHACHHMPQKRRGGSDEEDDEDDEDDDSQDEEESTEPCLQVCASEQYLLRHVQQCHAEKAKPFVCGIEGCGKSYTSSERLVDHQASHSTDKPFKCRMPDCDKVFRTRKNRRNHEMTHNDERPHACPWEGCGKRFSRKDNMMTHYKLHEKRTEEGLDALFGRGRGKRTKVSEEGSKSGRASATQQQQRQNHNNTLSDSRQQPSPNFNAANYPPQQQPRHPQPSFHDPNAAFPLYAQQTGAANRSPFGNRPNYQMSPLHHPMSPYADSSLPGHGNQFAPGTPNMTAANGNFAGSMNWAKAAPNMAHLQAPPFNSAPGTPGMIGMTRSPTHRGVNAAGLTLSPNGLYFPSPNLFGALSPLQGPNQNTSLPGPAQQP